MGAAALAVTERRCRHPIIASNDSNEIASRELPPASRLVPGISIGPELERSLSSVSVYVNSVGSHTGKISLTLIDLPSGVTYTFTPASITLTSTTNSVGVNLSIARAGAVLPLSDNFAALVEASAAGRGTSYAPVRLLMRSAQFT